eukprot:CAMPEP_0119388496 /NCGR_PEP_ID=MMETSP1334-20130426/105212_1 /TAXON_ID=127549 /ORGANISM="Calcidiscus leptoporus, Strain RCC1130" /LENGTH=49 /DNA_ID= /DNA_START= /DNA_END= /DNA_ORIENTATION=
MCMHREHRMHASYAPDACITSTVRPHRKLCMIDRELTAQAVMELLKHPT